MNARDFSRHGCSGLTKKCPRCRLPPAPGPCILRASIEAPLECHMVAVSVSRPRASWFRSKNLLFACIAVMMAYVLRHNERFVIDRSDAFWGHMQTFKWWLLPHGLAGACALLLAPLQFSDRLRQRFTKMHRIIGRIYIAGVFVLAPLGVYIQYLEERMGGTRSFTIATLVDAVLLTSAAALALYFIRNRKIQQHRQWMTRSYAVALVFFEEIG